MTNRRTYNQLCGLAAALDVVGERWTMLIVRDLALGPRRYGELLEGLPGIGEGLLAQRLRHLEHEDLVRRRFDAEVGAVVYELTDDGRDLWSALLPLTAWGVRRVASVRLDDARADWLAVALQARLDPAKSVGIHEQYELIVDDHAYTVVADDGEVAVHRGEATDPAVRVTIDLEAFLAIGVGSMTPAEARAAGRSTVEGDKAAAARYTALLRPLT